MRVKLSQLKSVVRQAIDEEKALDVLRKEVSSVLGPSVVVEVPLEKIAENANYRLNVLERTGRLSNISFNANIVSAYMKNGNSEVRKFVARVLPVNKLSEMIGDKNSSVRSVVAKRMPTHVVKEMLKRNPGDDQLRSILKERKLIESGVANPKVDDEPFDMYGEEPLGDSIKQSEGPDLSDAFYETLAHKFIMDYGNNIEGQWEESLVRNYVSGTKATNGVEIDYDKLLKAVHDQIEEREDRVLDKHDISESYSLRSIVDSLRESVEEETLNENALERVDEVQELYSSNLSAREYVDKANRLFNIKESTLPAAIKKYRQNSEMKESTIPVKGKAPHGSIRHIDERAMDLYVKHWMTLQEMSGEPLSLEWNHGPSEVGEIGFSVLLK